MFFGVAAYNKKDFGSLLKNLILAAYFTK